MLVTSRVRDVTQEKPEFTKARNIWVFLIVLGIVLGGLWLWIRSEQRAEPAPSSVSQPSSEWTTAPEGGVKVNLPETPMTNVPAQGSDPDPEQQVPADPE